MNELVPSVSIAALVNARAGVVERFGKAVELLTEAGAYALAAAEILDFGLLRRLTAGFGPDTVSALEKLSP